MRLSNKQLNIDRVFDRCEDKMMSFFQPILSLDDLRARLKELPVKDAAAVNAVRVREPLLTKPPGSLGKLEEIVEWLAGWQGSYPTRMDTPRVRIFAGNHGVVSEGVSNYPSEVTTQMVANFQTGGAAINQLCEISRAELKVISLELERPTMNFTKADAMSEEEFVAAFNIGADSFPYETDLLCVGEMGIGNTTAAAAICHAIFGEQASDWTGPGTGVKGQGFENKVRVVGDAVSLHKLICNNGLEVLRCLGGRELVAIAGALVAARFGRVPVILDGYVATAAAAAVFSVSSNALEHCIASHVSAEPAHRRLLEKLGKQALFDFGMRLGEASGAALAIPIVKAAHTCHAGMATFDEAGVSEKD